MVPFSCVLRNILVHVDGAGFRTIGVFSLTKIHDVYMTPDGRVESKEDDLGETLERDAEVLQRLRSPKS